MPTCVGDGVEPRIPLVGASAAISERLGTQTAIAHTIVSREADYVLSVKDNHPKLVDPWCGKGWYRVVTSVKRAARPGRPGMAGLPALRCGVLRRGRAA